MSIDLPFTLTPEQMEQNFATLMERIQLMFDSRANKLVKMYNDLEEAVMLSPASSVEHFHNSFPGGYLDHVLRVLDFSFQVYETWLNCGFDLSDFTPEELAFVAIHHDLGKVGLPGKGFQKYEWNTSEWHREKQGKIYQYNPNLPFMLIQDMSLFTLQKYEIPLSLNETLGIKLHDGLYDDANKPYYISNSYHSSLRTYLPYIVHQADLMASKFEYDRWAKASGKELKKYN